MMNVRIDYTNHRGELTTREIIPIEILYSPDNPWHGTGWVLMAIDVEKKARREFALRDIHKWEDIT